ncbi:putative aquaporin NIP5-1 [Iris pallida]|uniref:Aquaporin NIP5-1 n=1 Tax=Iris pallida TaxID=29817 RepID=A0AAX6EMR0_IRIPA|nr:putative aquaporin NIP5-1 [Iris pallida]
MLCLRREEFMLGAEFVGTFILIFGATAAPIVNQKYNGAETLIGNAACAGLAVMIVILSTGHISGGPSQPVGHHLLRGAPSLPLDPGARLHRGPGLCVHMRVLRAEGHLPPVPLRRCHRALRQHHPGILPRVRHLLQSHVRGHSCCY